MNKLFEKLNDKKKKKKRASNSYFKKKSIHVFWSVLDLFKSQLSKEDSNYLHFHIHLKNHYSIPIEFPQIEEIVVIMMIIIIQKMNIR